MKRQNGLRVAFVAGTLGQGGAEKQLTYMVRALLQEGVEARVYTLARGEFYEPVLKDLGTEVHWVGQRSRPPGRLIALTSALRSFRPHVVQSAHFYTNLYVGLAASFAGAVGIGAIRNDVISDLAYNPFWGKLLLTRIGSLVANSELAQHNARTMGVAADQVACLPNVIDLKEFDKQYQQTTSILAERSLESKVIVTSVGRLVSDKRFDRFIDALAIARQEAPELLGLIVGEGPEADNLRSFALQKGLSEECLLFLGRRDDVPAVLRRSHIFALTSDHEGFPNVVLEAMAARLPVITTPAGDSDLVVRDGVTGYVLPFEDIDGLAARMVDLARSAPLRTQLGQEGRAVVEQQYGTDGLAARLLSIYRQAGERRGSRRLIQVL